LNIQYMHSSSWRNRWCQIEKTWIYYS
jgi:hypothetical protein